MKVLLVNKIYVWGLHRMILKETINVPINNMDGINYIQHSPFALNQFSVHQSYMDENYKKVI